MFLQFWASLDVEVGVVGAAVRAVVGGDLLPFLLHLHLYQTEKSTLDLDLVLGQRMIVVVKVLGLVHPVGRIKGVRMGKAPQRPVVSCSVVSRKDHCRFMPKRKG